MTPSARLLRTLGTLSVAAVTALAAPPPRGSADDAARAVPGSRLDPGGAVPDATGEWLWYDARRLTVEGRGWDDTERFFDRLPGRARAAVPEPVWGLARHSAGIGVRFGTDADTIAARWTLTTAELSMPHMPATGVSGLDLYVRDRGSWRWIGSGRPTAVETQAVLVKGIPSADPAGTIPVREYLLFLPLYNGVTALEIGVPPTAVMRAAAAGDARPIVFYGTSITQGGCASRPGMAYPAILRRRLDRPVINLGFSGNGRLDAGIGDLLAELDAAAYVLDCAANMSPEQIAERTEPFVATLRGRRPETPIVLVGNLAYPAGAFLPASRERVAAKNALVTAAFDRLTAQGITGLHVLPGDTLLGVDGEDTVDGTHPTDLGFLRMADAIEPLLRRLVDRPRALTTGP